ncbi:BrnT family toxin [Glaesserella parasuis]|uniref:BrnT family toxin n=1 Tax=Glaesserella parasuis TaxID=738 RepID=UPI00311CD6EA
MLINYDPNKSNKNITERGLSFDEVAFFEWKTAIIKQDERFHYPEPRFVAVGFLKRAVTRSLFYANSERRKGY